MVHGFYRTLRALRPLCRPRIWQNVAHHPTGFDHTQGAVMSDESTRPTLTRREMLGTMGAVAAGTVVATSLVEAAFGESGVLAAQATPVNAVAGVDRVVMLKGKTYLRGWTGYGLPPGGGRRGGGGGRGAAPPEPAPTGPT